MKTPRLVLCSLVFGGALLASAHAQLVHLAFTDSKSNSGMGFRADSMDVRWHSSGGYISQFDLWYNPSDPTDATTNIWRATVVADLLGTFEIVRSHQIRLHYGDFFLSQYQDIGVYEEMEFMAEIDPQPAFDPDTGLSSGLPLPPFAVTSHRIVLNGGPSFFDAPHFAEGRGSGAFNQVTVTVEPSVIFRPVPEPSTYGLAAMAGLVLAVFYGRRRRRESAGTVLATGSGR